MTSAVALAQGRNAEKGSRSALVRRDDGTARVAAEEILRIFVVLGLVVACYWVPLLLLTEVTSGQSALLSILLVGTVAVAVAIASPYTALLFAILSAMLQNVLLGLMYGGSAEIPVVISETKSIIAVALIGVLLCRALLKGGHLVRFVVLSFAWPLLIVGHSAGLDISSVSNARNFFLPFVLLLALASWRVPATRNAWARLYVLSFFMSVLLAAGSLVELAVGEDQWERWLNIDSLAGLNALSDTTMAFGRTATRVGGLLIEPINSGYVAAFVLAFALLELFRSLGANAAQAIMLAMACALSLITILLAATKNSLLVAATAVIAFILLKAFPNRRGLAVFLAVMAGVALTFLYTTVVKGAWYITSVWTDPYGSSGGESASIHIAGLLLGIYSLFSNPLGHGVGTGGNFYRLYHPEITRQQWLASGSESAVGTLAYQLGVIGLLLAVVTVAVVFPRLTDTGAAILAAWLTASFFAEPIFGAIVCIPALAFAGLLTEDAGQAKRSHQGSRIIPPSRHLLTTTPKRRQN